MTPMQTIREALNLGVKISDDEYSGTCIHEDEHMPIFKAAYDVLASLESERPKLPRAMLSEIYASGFASALLDDFARKVRERAAEKARRSRLTSYPMAINSCTAFNNGVEAAVAAILADEED